MAQYARALRFADALHPAERADLLQRRSHQCYVADQPGDAIEDLERALECRRRLGDRRGEGDVLRSLSGILWCPGRAADAERAGTEAVAVLAPLGPGRELAMAYANLAALAMNREDPDETAVWGAKALDLAREIGDETIEINALNSLGTMAFLVGGRDADEPAIAASIARSAQGSSRRPYARIRTWLGQRCATAPMRGPTAI
jgi:tetratricopeptide (TPR) repeat protein